MTERLLPREQVFQNWGVDETFRTIGTAFEESACNWTLQDVKKWIAQHHTSVNDPYFYSAKKVNQHILLKSKEQRIFRSLFVACFATCIGVAVVVYWKTRPYFERKWAECQALAETKKYAIYKGLFRKFERYAAAQDLWERHEVGASGKYLLRNALCITSPLWGSFVALTVSNVVSKSHRDDTFWKRSAYPYDILLERSKDERVCPPNFDIQTDVDPLTQEDLSSEKLQSPQMIYLPNYVTDAKAFMLAILRVGEKEFPDPYCRRDFSTEEHQAIVSQILAIFQISEEELDQCFEVGEKAELIFDLFDSHRYERDARALDERGQFTEDARAKLQYCFGDLEDPTIPQIDALVDQGIEQMVSEIKEQLLGNPLFQILMGISQSSPIELIPRFVNVNVLLLVPIGSVSFPVPINLTPFLVLQLLKELLPAEEIKKTERMTDQIKEDIRRNIRSRILQLTGFHSELREDDRAISRIEYFEKIAGVSLREVSQEV
ncbi:MAG: hypothetical protein H7A41_00790 [Chlamydiales bacterium]|nr:hypothetical protein [Chlamydiales bacterium]